MRSQKGPTVKDWNTVHTSSQIQKILDRKLVKSIGLFCSAAAAALGHPKNIRGPSGPAKDSIRSSRRPGTKYFILCRVSGGRWSVFQSL